MIIIIRAKEMGEKKVQKADVNISAEHITSFFKTTEALTIFMHETMIRLSRKDYYIQEAYGDLMSVIPSLADAEDIDGYSNLKAKLLPCPMCGGEADIGKDEDGYWVGCKQCDIIAKGLMDENSTLFHWNYMIAE